MTTESSTRVANKIPVAHIRTSMSILFLNQSNEIIRNLIRIH